MSWICISYLLAEYGAKGVRMDLGLQGKVALVTGGSRGIGRAIVHDLAKEGCHMAFSARGGEALRATEREVAALGAQVLAVQADMTNTAEIEHFVNKADD